MPELPEVRAHAERLADALEGDTLSSVRLLGFSSLKTYAPPLDGAVGTTLTGATSRGKHLLLHFGKQTHVIHLMQAGRLRPDPKESKKPRGGLVRWTFAEGGSWLLTEAGTERKAGVWVVEGDPMAQEPLDRLGPDADAVDLATFTAAVKDDSARIHTFLRHQDGIAGVGRMLANEICHRARLSPFATTRSLDDEQIARVHAAMGEAISEALATERAREDMSSSKDRPSRVHNRVGEACPVCDDVVRAVEYNAYTVCYCATCQTDGRILADNTTSKFLK